MKITWILNGEGLCSDTLTGSPKRFLAVSSRWTSVHKAVKQQLVTTCGGSSITSQMGCELPKYVLPASFFLKKEPFKAFRIWSYFVSALSSLFMWRKVPASDYCITVSDYFCDVVPAMVFKRRGIASKWIAWIHHKELHPSTRPGNRIVNTVTWCIQEWSFKCIAKYADQAWVLDSAAGDLVAERLVELGLSKGRIRRMKNGVDLDPIKALPQPDKCVDAVMIGVRPNKGLHDIVPVWQNVQKLRPGTTLSLMGGMTGVDALKEQIEKAGLSDVISFANAESAFLPFKEFIKKIKECRVMFAPSHEEGWGIAHCEAMACGLPVVAYDLPVYKRVYGDAVLKVAESDYKAFAEAVCSLLDDSELYERYVVHGCRAADNYNWDNIGVEDWNTLMGGVENE